MPSSGAGTATAAGAALRAAPLPAETAGGGGARWLAAVARSAASALPLLAAAQLDLHAVDFQLAARRSCDSSSSRRISATSFAVRLTVCLRRCSSHAAADCPSAAATGCCVARRPHGFRPALQDAAPRPAGRAPTRCPAACRSAARSAARPRAALQVARRSDTARCAVPAVVSTSSMPPPAATAPAAMCLSRDVAHARSRR